jgi:hypothetical protein
MKFAQNRIVRAARVRTWLAIPGLLLSCGCSSTVASEPPAAAQAVVDPQILQFRIVAGTGTDELACERAQALQEKESKLGHPWSTEVYRDPEVKKELSARWVRCDSSFAELFLGNRDVLLRRLPEKAGGAAQYEVLLLADNFNINRVDFERVTAGFDSQGFPCVLFSMTPAGAKRLFNLTSRRLPVGGGNHSHMAIVVDGNVISAPRLNEAVSDNGQITGNFTLEEVERLANLCNKVLAKTTSTAKPTGTSTPKPTGTGKPKASGADSRASKAPAAQRP